MVEAVAKFLKPQERKKDTAEVYSRVEGKETEATLVIQHIFLQYGRVKHPQLLAES